MSTALFIPPLLSSLSTVLRLRGRPVSPHRLVANLGGGFAPPSAEECLAAAEAAKVTVRLLPKAALGDIPEPTLPCVLLLAAGADGHAQSCVLLEKDEENARVIFPETEPAEQRMPLADLAAMYAGRAVFVVSEPKRDARVEDIAPPQKDHWFKGALARHLGIYRDVALAGFVINVLALAGPLFIMNVYDRVVPNNALYTLWVLFIGLLFAHCMDFLLRNLRSYYVDLAGRNADVLMASRLMERIVHMRLDNKPESTGALVNNLREFEQVREFFGSTTLVALLDLPFLLLFVGIVAYIGGPVVFLIVLTLPLMLLFVRLVQIPFQRSVERQFRQNMQKNSLLVEIVAGLETVKSCLAQAHMRKEWESVVDASAAESARGRRLSGLAGTGALFITYLVNAGVILWGVYLIAEGRMTQGGLIACVILTGRALGPLMQLATMLTQLQKSRVALSALQLIMDLPTEQREAEVVEISGLAPRLALDHVSFTYPKGGRTALRDLSLAVEPGEKVGVVGRTGSGKSTLARLLVGLYQPQEGGIAFGGVDIRQIDQAELRSRIGFMPQENYLFYGSVRDNIALGCPWVDSGSLVAAAELAGVADFVRRHPLGYDMPVGERGSALSGGQRQAVALARTLVRSPDILILDEPSSNLDMESEHALMLRLKEVVRGKTLIIMTHRPSLLSLVDRVLALREGALAADGPRDLVLRALREQARKEGKA